MVVGIDKAWRQNKTVRIQNGGVRRYLHLTLLSHSNNGVSSNNHHGIGLSQTTSAVDKSSANDRNGSGRLSALLY